MTDFAKCNDCVAITLDTDEDISKHRNFHKDLDKKIEAQRRVALDAKQAVTQLRAEIAEYERNLKASLITVEPDTINIHDFPDDDDPEPDDIEPDTIENDEPIATAPAPATVPDYVSLPAIDRDDEYVPIPTAPAVGPTGTAENLFLG